MKSTNIPKGHTLQDVLMALDMVSENKQNSIEERIERLEVTVAALTLLLGLKGEKDGDATQVEE